MFDIDDLIVINSKNKVIINNSIKRTLLELRRQLNQQTLLAEKMLINTNDFFDILKMK